MAEVVIQSGTRDELAGVTIGSGNVWVRPGDEAVSVELALPDSRVVLFVGDHVELGGQRCTLVKIEPAALAGAHKLHFRTESAEPATPDVSPADGEKESTGQTGSTVDAALGEHVSHDGDVVPVADTIIETGIDNPTSALRRSTPNLLALLGVAAIGATGGWERSEREEWVEIDRAACGPNTTTTWTWPAPDGECEPGELMVGAQVREEVIRWSPDHIHDVTVSGTWHHGADRLFASLYGSAPPRHLRVSGLAPLIERATAIVLAELGTDDQIVVESAIDP